MINRQNWQDTLRYLEYLENVKLLSYKSVHKIRGELRHLLEWADETSFTNARHIDPSYPAFLAAQKSKRSGQLLAPSTILKSLQFTRDFFYYARSEWPTRYKSIKESWVDLLRPPRYASIDSEIIDHQFYTLEDVTRMLAVSVETLRVERAQAAAAMLFLSAMRVDALGSLRVNCVDLVKQKILQWPKLGVRTKNHKAATTSLLDIPELLQVVQRWDDRVSGFRPGSLWYAPIAFDGTSLTETDIAIEGRGGAIGADIEILCDLAGLDYLSPHHFRHGHIMHALSQARDMNDLRAISQNVMHASVVITNQVYGKLASNNIHNVISNLGKQKNATNMDIQRMIELLQSQIIRED